MPRARTGSLVWTGKAWSCRIAGGPLIPLHTSDKRVARARLKATIAGTPAPTTPTETFETAARRIVEELAGEGMVTADRRLSRLVRFAFPAIGDLLVTEVRPGHVTALLAEAAEKHDMSKGQVILLRNDIGKIFAELVRDEMVATNPARAERVRTPKARVDKRRRALLTDAEFLALIQAPTTRPQLRVMAIVSRAFGGMRTSDLHEFKWSDIDLVGWAHADVPRPKTEHHHEAPRERIAMPPEVVEALVAWRASQGGLSAGPVFPLPPRREKWRGQPTRGTRPVPSYARELRAALLAAGIARHELHHPTEKTKPVDFHSFRRAFVTAVGAAGLNAQTAMRLAGHRSMATHQRYNQPEVLAIPEAALPRIDAEDDAFEKAIQLFNPEDLPVDLLPYVVETTAKDASVPNGIRTRVTALKGPDHASNFSSKTAESDETPTLSELSDVAQKSHLLHGVASKFAVVDSKLSFRAAADAALRAYLRGCADALADASRVQHASPVQTRRRFSIDLHKVAP